MPNGKKEQRNPYKGDPARAWVKVTFEKADGTGNIEKELLADLGDPHEGVISKDNMKKLKLGMVRTKMATGVLRKEAGSASKCQNLD